MSSQRLKEDKIELQKAQVPLELVYKYKGALCKYVAAWKSAKAHIYIYCSAYVVQAM